MEIVLHLLAYIFGIEVQMKTQYFQKYWALPYSILEKNSQDALLISTHAPGLPVNNQVEKKMASLSKALSGILLPHDKFGTHLNSSRKSINTNLKNVTSKSLVKFWQKFGKKLFLTISLFWLKMLQKFL